MPTDAFSQEYKGPYNRVVLVNGLIANPTAVFPDGTMVYDRITRDFYLLAGDWVLLPNLARQYANVASLPLDAPAGSIAITQDDGGMYRFEDGSWVLLNRALANSTMAGTGAPPVDLGLEGDTYIDTATGTLWGPKTAAGWEHSTSLVGPQGETGLPGAGIAWRGAWNGASAYVAFDGVEHDGSAWVANADNTGAEPGVAPEWDLWIQKGEDGVDGEKGDTGDATLPGSVTSLELADDAVTTPKLEDGAVTNAKIRNSVGLSVIGRTSSTTGAVADIVAGDGADGHVLRRSGTSLAFGTIGAGALAPSAIRDKGLSLSAAATSQSVGANSTYVVPRGFWLITSQGGPFYTEWRTNTTSTFWITAGPALEPGQVPGSNFWAFQVYSDGTNFRVKNGGNTTATIWLTRIF